MDPYLPKPLPPDTIDWVSILPLIGQANRSLAHYDGLRQHMVNPAVLLSPMHTQEAVLSSRIEGTQASLKDVLEYEAEARPNEVPSDSDIHEIINYRQATQVAIDLLEKRPLSLNLIRNIHYVLLDSVRGANMSRGEFRTTQNYIAPAGTPIEQATYVPPEPQHVPDLLHNLEEFIHTDEPDILVQLALLHAQFELIHPFLDGNGRVGRILIPLFLYEKRVLLWPAFFMSGYLEANREEYYARLKALSDANDFQGWIRFFLEAIVTQADANVKQVRDIMALYERMKLETANMTRSHTSIQALDALFNRPLFSTVQFTEQVDASRTTCGRILRNLVDGGVVQQIRTASGRQSAVYIFSELLNILG